MDNACGMTGRPHRHGASCQRKSGEIAQKRWLRPSSTSWET
jgi:hypothetical protein